MKDDHIKYDRAISIPHDTFEKLRKGQPMTTSQELPSTINAVKQVEQCPYCSWNVSGNFAKPGLANHIGKKHPKHSLNKIYTEAELQNAKEAGEKKILDLVIDELTKIKEKEDSTPYTHINLGEYIKRLEALEPTEEVV